MTILTSRRHRTKFYLAIIFGVFAFMAIGTIMLIVYLQTAKDATGIKAKHVLLPVFSFACFAMAIYTVYRYYKNAPIICVDKDHIQFGKKVFNWTELKGIKLIGKRPFAFLFDFPMEAAALKFNDAKTMYIFDDMYENSWELKLFLKQVVIDKGAFSNDETPAINISETESAGYDIFDGRQVPSLRGLSLWGVIVPVIYVMLTKKGGMPGGLIDFLTLFSAFWFVFNSWMMNYIKVSQGYLVVRNKNMFWKKRAFRLSEISEIIFETRGRMPNCLRIITKDFKNKFYPAATLRNKTWLALKANLESHKITVRNECIFE